MNIPELDALLLRTLADHKLSKGERQDLLGFALKQIDSEQDRQVAQSRVFALAQEALTDEDSRRVLQWAEDAMKALLPGGAKPNIAGEASQAYFSPGDACLGQIHQRFATARRTVDICVFTITDDRITRCILDAHRRGVQIRIITDNEKEFDAGSDIDELRRARVPVRVDRTPYHMHHKFALFDGVRLLNGSYNWTRGAARDNEENITDLSDPRLVAAFQKCFDDLWDSLGD